ncbi:hypothetical protein FJT64_007774 [Amphibalanus amphitrite]|uniref:Uncharacterized protein n=1 Tax=Amphibalanus amphitrite TaxID=1232801 RepID=A0A6A4VT23_AMPAM|nr:hypothetical protein FJT64_007774 [Amphibalanus amphitrite]
MYLIMLPVFVSGHDGHHGWLSALLSRINAATAAESELLETLQQLEGGPRLTDSNRTHTSRQETTTSDPSDSHTSRQETTRRYF